MTAKTSSVDITDMDCSSAEIEELIKEVRPFLTLNHCLPLTSGPSPSSVICVSRCASLPLSLFVTFFLSDYHTVLSPPSLFAQSMHTLPHDLHDYEVYKGALLTTYCFFVCLFVFQEDCSIQASPEYWSQSSINSKAYFCTSHSTLSVHCSVCVVALLSVQA